MNDTVHSLASRLHDLLVEHSLTRVSSGPPARPGAVIEELAPIAEGAGRLGPDARWIIAVIYSAYATIGLRNNIPRLALVSTQIAVQAGYNDCLQLGSVSMSPLHHHDQFRALYQQIRISEADLDELRWQHRELLFMARDLERAGTDNITRRDTHTSRLPQAPMPTRVPDTPGILAARLEVQAAQSALQNFAMKAEMSRAANNMTLSMMDSWDYGQARRDAWSADAMEAQIRNASAARAYLESPGLSHAVVHCPPLGS
ncbi:hypothetical protein ACF061_28215 [Streptomyces sp. NPDC015220]|uniref:hypothetical protein n=1 Tax=Streptomyces sp. NPDC015220 TaxID=3364947 RepID=UPI003702611B